MQYHDAISTCHVTHVVESNRQFTQMGFPWHLSRKVAGSCLAVAAAKLPVSCPVQKVR